MYSNWLLSCNGPVQRQCLSTHSGHRAMLDVIQPRRGLLSEGFVGGVAEGVIALEPEAPTVFRGARNSWRDGDTRLSARGGVFQEASHTTPRHVDSERGDQPATCRRALLTVGLVMVVVWVWLRTLEDATTRVCLAVACSSAWMRNGSEIGSLQLNVLPRNRCGGCELGLAILRDC
jgi:hypothetical protein